MFDFDRALFWMAVLVLLLFTLTTAPERRAVVKALLERVRRVIKGNSHSACK